MVAIVAHAGDRQRQVDLGVARRPRQAAHGSGVSASRSAIHSSDRERLRPTIGGDGAGRQRGIDALAVQARQLPRQHVVDHLAALAEAGLHQTPQLVLVLRSRGGEARGSPTRMAESTSGAGSKAAAGTVKATSTWAWYWTKTER